MQAGRDRVLHVVRFALVRVREEAHVALETAVADQGFDPGALGGVVGVGGADGWVTGFDVGDDGFGVGREGVRDEGGEVGVGRDGGGNEEVGFVEDVGEDEGVEVFPVVALGFVSCVGGRRWKEGSVPDWNSKDAS